MSGLPPTVTESTSSLPSLAICNAQARARLYLQGAHLAEWRPVGAEEVLWQSVRSLYAPGKPIRGGVPICFPWFGAHPERPELAPHGFARLRAWSLEAATDLPDGRTRLNLSLRDDPETRALWPHRFVLGYAVTIGSALELALTVTNEGETPFTCEEALHTYLGVGDIGRTTVAGLEGAPFWDKVAGDTRTEAHAIAFTAETDRVYPGNEATCTVEDAALGRRLRVAKSGSRTTVVWNPWTAKAARMPDYGDGEWPGMVCVETANAAADRITLPPGQSHRMSATISLLR